ncbi:MAG: immunoglobulin domain-containing protein [Bacilli bacterium]|nr:immunoglobulin domain-containing protein [Bacilli bacterium]
MKKIVYTLFVICISFLAFCSVKTISAENSSVLYYSYLDTEAQKYYDALVKMEHENMFAENKSLDLISEGVVTCKDIEEYSYGSTKINSCFEIAKKAFFLDHEEVFYLDETKISLRIYINEKDEYVCMMGSEVFEEAFIEGITVETIKATIKEHEEKVKDIVRSAKALETIKEKIDFVTTNNDPKTIKACLDSLDIINYLYEYNEIANGIYQKHLVNLYVVEGISYVVNTHETADVLKNSDYHFSTPYYELNNITTSFPIILENYNDAVDNTVFASKKTNTTAAVEGILVEETYDMYFFVNGEICNELDKKQSILMPYPEGFGYQHSNIEYVVTTKALEDAQYVETPCVATPLGIVIELDKSSNVIISAKVRIEDIKDRGFIIITDIGGTTTLDTISFIEENKNLKFEISADLGYVIDQILVDGKSMKFSKKNNTEYSINYEEIRDGSIVQILFVDRDFDKNEYKHIEYKKQELTVEISGKPYVYTGKNAMLTASTNAVGDVTYEWFKDGKAIEGSNSKHLIIMGMEASDRGNYSVKVTSSGGYCVSEQISDDFLLLDTVNTDANPLPYLIIFSVFVLLVFAGYVIIDNATHSYSKDDE